LPPKEEKQDLAQTSPSVAQSPDTRPSVKENQDEAAEQKSESKQAPVEVRMLSTCLFATCDFVIYLVSLPLVTLRILLIKQAPVEVRMLSTCLFTTCDYENIAYSIDSFLFDKNCSLIFQKCLVLCAPVLLLILLF
jgi:hypothetical protein